MDSTILNQLSIARQARELRFLMSQSKRIVENIKITVQIEFW